VFLPCRPPQAIAVGSSSHASSPLQSSQIPTRQRSACARLRHASHRVTFLFAVSAGTVHRADSVALAVAHELSTARFVPPAPFLTASAVSSVTSLASLFHPATTSRIHSPGVFPLGKHDRLVTSHCPLVVRAHSLPLRLNSSAPGATTRLQGFHPAEDPSRSNGGLAHPTARSPLELHLPRVLLCKP